MSFECSVKITEDMFELPYRHIHHAEIIRLLEHGRRKYMDAIGYPLEGFLERELFLVITEINVKYKREVVEGEYRITVEQARVLDPKRLIAVQRIINPKGKDAVWAEVEIMCIDGRLKRSVAIEDEFLKAFLG